MAKVQKPAKHVDDQEVSSVTAVATTGADVTAKGLVKVTTASSGILLLSEGEWNGQECLLIIDSGSNDLTIKNDRDSLFSKKLYAPNLEQLGFKLDENGNLVLNSEVKKYMKETKDLK